MIQNMPYLTKNKFHLQCITIIQFFFLKYHHKVQHEYVDLYIVKLGSFQMYIFLINTLFGH